MYPVVIFLKKSHFSLSDCRYCVLSLPVLLFACLLCFVLFSMDKFNAFLRGVLFLKFCVEFLLFILVHTLKFRFAFCVLSEQSLLFTLYLSLFVTFPSCFFAAVTFLLALVSLFCILSTRCFDFLYPLKNKAIPSQSFLKI